MTEKEQIATAAQRVAAAESAARRAEIQIGKCQLLDALEKGKVATAGLTINVTAPAINKIAEKN
jgi:hypothetical protein